jgi:LPXTG-motif cell wall-anchored protein
MPKRLGLILGAAALLAVAGSMLAQEIVVISGNTVVIRDAQGTRKYTMLPESNLMVDGKEVTVRELKPGMRVTTAPPGPGETVVVTQVREGKVLEVSGTNLIVREGDTAVKRYIVDPDFKFIVDGKEAPVTSLQPGMVLTTMIVTKASPTTESAVAAADAAAAKADAAARRAANAKADADAAAKKAADARARADAAAARQLPKTASSMPLIGLLGLASLAAGLTVRAARRSRTV